MPARYSFCLSKIIRSWLIVITAIAITATNSVFISNAEADELPFAGSFSINTNPESYNTFPRQASSNVPVNLMNEDYLPPDGFHYTSHGISFKFELSSHDTKCYPDSSSFNRESVILKRSANFEDSNEPQIPLYAASSNLSSTQKSFSLSALQTGFELRPETNYKLRLTKDIVIICKSGRYALASPVELVFKTGKDAVAPIISDHLISTTANAATVAWTTSDPNSKAVVYYGAGNLSSKIKANDDPTKFSKPHAVIKGLRKNTAYNYLIKATDAAGNSRESKGTFNTWNISSISVSDITAHEATLKWSTSVTTDSIVYYATDKKLLQNPTDATPGIRRSGSLDPVKSHNIRLVNLDSKQKYFARVVLSRGNATSTSAIFSFSTGDASGGFVIEPPPIDLEFISDFDLSEFNFKDFPPDDLEASGSGQEASGGAVLASTDAPLESIAGNFSEYITAHPWLVWLWVPVLILLALIVAVWLLWRHEKRIKRLRIEAKS